jgi:hypothetical protein
MKPRNTSERDFTMSEPKVRRPGKPVPSSRDSGDNLQPRYPTSDYAYGAGSKEPPPAGAVGRRRFIGTAT